MGRLGWGNELNQRPEKEGIKTISGYRAPPGNANWIKDLKKKGLRLAGGVNLSADPKTESKTWKRRD